jgi:hypothetical protein
MLACTGRRGRSWVCVCLRRTTGTCTKHDSIMSDDHAKWLHSKRVNLPRVLIWAYMGLFGLIYVVNVYALSFVFREIGRFFLMSPLIVTELSRTETMQKGQLE